MSRTENLIIDYRGSFSEIPRDFCKAVDIAKQSPILRPKVEKRPLRI